MRPPQMLSAMNARLIGKDRQTDLAVIKIDLERLPFPTFADSDTLSQGQIVLAFGSPLGLDNSVSMGKVSGTQLGGLTSIAGRIRRSDDENRNGSTFAAGAKPPEHVEPIYLWKVQI